MREDTDKKQFLKKNVANIISKLSTFLSTQKQHIYLIINNISNFTIYIIGL